MTIQDYKNIANHIIEMQKDLNAISKSDRFNEEQILVIIYNIINTKNKLKDEKTKLKHLDFENLSVSKQEEILDNKLTCNFHNLICRLEKIKIRVSLEYLVYLNKILN